MITPLHTHFRGWQQDGNDAVHSYRGRELRIKYNPRTGYCDGYVEGEDADLHCRNMPIGLSALARMLQQAVDKRLDGRFKYAEGQRIHSAKCISGGVLRGNGCIKSRCTVHIDGDEPCYLIAFAAGTYHVLESDINP